MESCLVPAGYGEAEYTDKKSRFIGQVSPVSDEAGALAFVERARREHPGAAHHVWAYSLRDGGLRWSDDGEPGGTAGQPTLNVFRSAGVLDVCCVVIRYFGGILLGSGGLVRAYSKAAALALEAAGLSRLTSWLPVRIVCAYPQYDRVRRLLSELGAAEAEAGFGESISVSALLPAESAADFGSRLADATAAGAAWEAGEPVLRPRRAER